MPPRKTIEEKYQKLTDIEHVLLRPGMYVGSTKPREEEVFLLRREEGPEGEGDVREVLRKTPIIYNPAFLKLFDEVISNSVDEHRRNPMLIRIEVSVDLSKNTIVIWDNGGIPVVKHSEHNEWVPELIFSNLKAGSNFDDDEARLVAGTNGVGATLTNIFSLMFQVRTCDGKNEFKQVFRDNMNHRDEPVVKKVKGKTSGYTEITYIPDLSRFGMTEINELHAEMMEKRCLELAACNPNLSIAFHRPDLPKAVSVEFSFTSFEEYCKMYAAGGGELFYEEAGPWKVSISPSGGSFEQVSYVNSVETIDGGTHVEHVMWPIVAWVREHIKKKHKIDLKPQEIRNHFFVVVQADIVNPAFSSQTKEKLITESREFGSKYEPSEALLRKIFGSEIVGRILDWAQEKELANERRKLRELNKKVDKEKVLKLIDAKAPSGRTRCSLALFEGDSAISAFRKYRDPQFQGAFPLRGKVLNVTERAATSIINNTEIWSLLIALGLKMGEEPKDLRYGRILIYADADPDGDSITGLLVNFFGRYWPELFEQQRVLRVMTPLMVAQKGKTRISFYTNAEFDEWAKRQNLSLWDISYKKGLAALEDHEYEEIIKNPKMFAIVPGHDMRSVLDCWFARSAAPRKAKILGLDEFDELPEEDEIPLGSVDDSIDTK